ncbi:unnamed protein product [Nyctereutes procyonoides]|uniref:(raccoon dog) hypothetical protein n=1 Tax=Nyctereutes procyonoides TaxID=34880 RepID=A0A811ZET9_NYCPR|nr:unnamed protein product [Nyctereutes procyonoides]
MSTSIYTPKWFLQCFLGWTPFSLTLKLWDAYVLDGKRVLTVMAYTILKVHRTGPEEFPMRPLGLERVSPPPPRVEEPASLGPATQPEPPGPPPGQAIIQLPPQRWNSLPTLPLQQDGAGRRPPDMVGFETKNGVPFPSAPVWATPGAPRWTRPWSTPGTPITGSPQPLRDDAVRPRTLFLPRGHCSLCPSLGSDGHSQGRARAALSPLPRGPHRPGTLCPPRPRCSSMFVGLGGRAWW